MNWVIIGPQNGLVGPIGRQTLTGIKDDLLPIGLSWIKCNEIHNYEAKVCFKENAFVNSVA